MKNKAIILLSGGLDSLVSLALTKEEFNVELALTFNYGQKSYKNEYEASKKICEYYKIEHEVISLDWLDKISTSSLNRDENTSILTGNSLWVPNRNGLFINIAACFADSKNYTHIIIGANKEESETFKDNSQNFIDAINISLLNSTASTPKVIAPLIESDKKEIVKKGIEFDAPFHLVHSCYLNEIKHCGKCESCLRLKRALELNNRQDLVSKIF